MASNKEIRSNLTRHMYRMHGAFQTDKGRGYTLEALEKMHEDMHLDNYMCPPHSHPRGEPSEFDLEYGEKYIEQLTERHTN